MSSYLLRVWTLAGVLLLLTGIAPAQEKESAVRSGVAQEPAQEGGFARPITSGSSGTRFDLTNGTAQVPVAVVRGTPYEMGWQLGQLMHREMQEFIPPALAGIAGELKVSQDVLVEVWARSAAFADDRVEQEMAGLADGSGVPLRTLQAMHAVPLLMPYSCSSIAAWGDATADGHLYQTRNLDWSLEVGAHEFPVIVVYVPTIGIPHVVPSFAGVIGAHTGMNARGIVLAEMGDAPAKEMPYQVHAPHFTAYFRTLLYDADSLTRTLDIFLAQPMTKRYHFVFGDGRNEHRAVKIRAHSSEAPDRRVIVWKDNDPTDEFAPNVMPGVVYNDEGRGACPLLKKDYGKLNGEKLIEVANRIPIKGGNVVDTVYDATDLRLWVSYAKGNQEAYQRPYVFLDLKALDANHDGKPDFK
ncbi:MAG: C45 family autoproteolytic acyltransferase/hydrolase [Burkholderiales bacterium]